MIFTIYFIVLVGTLLIGLLRYNRLIPAQKFVVLILLLTIIIESFNYYLLIQNQHNLWLSHIFTPLETLLLLSAFATEIPFSHKLGVLLFSVPVLFEVANSTLLQPLFTTMNTYSSILQTFIVVALFLKYLQTVMDMDRNVQLLKYPLLIALLAFSIFDIFSLTSTGLFNYYYLNNLPESKALSHFHISSNFLLYILLFISFMVHQSIKLENVQ